MAHFFKKFIPFIIVVGFLIFVINLVIDNPYTHRLARMIINEKLKAMTALSIDFKAIKVSLVPLGADLYGFTVSTGDEKKELLLSASHIQGRISLWSIIIGTPKLGLLVADDLEFSWPFSPEAMQFLGLDKAPAPDADTRIFWPPEIETIPVDTFVLKNARLYFELPKQMDHASQESPFGVSLSGFDAKFDIDAIDDFAADLAIGNVNLKSFGRNILADTKLQAELNFVSDQLKNSKFSITSAQANLRGAIKAELKTNLQTKELTGIDLSLAPKGEGDIAILGQILEIDETHGKVLADATVNMHIPVAKGKSFTFSTHGNAKSQDAQIGGFLLYNTDVDLEIDLNKILFKNAKVLIGTADHGRAEGELTFSPLSFAFQGQPNALPLSKILHLVGVEFDVVDTDITSSDLSITGKGEPFSMQVKANAGFKNLAFKNLPTIEKVVAPPPQCNIYVNLKIDSKHVGFDDTQGSCFLGEQVYSSKVDFSGLVTFKEKDGMNLQIHSPELQLNLLSYYVQKELSGTAAVTTQIFGPYNNIVLANTVKAKGIVLESIPLEKVEGKIFLKNKSELHWSNLKVTPASGGYLLAPEGMLNLGNEEHTVKTQLEIKDVEKSVVSPLIGIFVGDPKLSFDIKNLEANIHGPLAAPFAYQGTLTVALENLKVDETLFFNEATGTLNLTPDAISTKDFSVGIGDFNTSTSLKYKRKTSFNYKDAQASPNLFYRLGLNPKDSLEIQSHSVVRKRKKRTQTDSNTEMSADHLQNLPFIGEYFKRFYLQSHISYKANLQGNLEGLQGNLEAEFHDLTFLNVALAAVNSEVIITQNAIDVIFHHGGSALEGRMKIDRSHEALPFDFYLQAKRFDLRFLGGSYFASDPRNFAYLNGDWKMQGHLTNFWQANGELNIKDIQLQYIRDLGSEVRSLYLNSSEAVAIKMESGHWNIAGNQPLILSGQNLELRLVTKNNRLPDNLGLYLDGVINLSLLRTLFPQVETASGKLRFTGSITKAISDPDIRFEFQDVKSNVFTQTSWEPVVIGLADIRPAFSQCEFKVRLENRKIIIDSLTATKGKGRLSATGTLILFDETATEDSRINLEFKEIAVNYPVAVFKSFDTLLSGNITINGKTKPYNLSGMVRIDRARSTTNFDIRREIIDALQRRPFYSPLVVEKPFFKLDIQALASQSISIRNQNVQALLSTNLKIEGSEVSPSILGQMEIAQGKFTYKREFNVSQGIMTFDNPVTPDPRLDILAVSEVSGYSVYVAITGRGSEPKVDLSVDPPTKPDGTAMTKVDILLLLSTGSPPSTQERQVSTESAATSEALNILAGQFEENIERLFDISGQKVVREIYIDTYSDPAKEGKPTARVNLPLNVHEDWDVIFGVDEHENWRVSLGYDLHQSISVTGTYERVSEEESLKKQTPTDTGVDLKFQFAFP